jgi:hypothetical protein
MKKLVKIAFLYIPIFVVVLYIVCSFVGWKRVFLNSPDGSKTVTFYSFSFFSNKFYTIPYKYTDLFPPKDNYCTEKIRVNGDFINYKLINWHPSDGSYLKMSADCITNKLHDNIKISEKYNDAIDEIDLDSKDIKYREMGMSNMGTVKRYPLKYIEYGMHEIDSTAVSFMFVLIVAFLVLIVEPILCLILLISVFLKKIDYWTNNT